MLTPQGAERLASPTRSADQWSLRFELESPGGSRAHSLDLLWATTTACSATRLGCVAMPRAQPPINPPGSESW